MRFVWVAVVGEGAIVGQVSIEGPSSGFAAAAAPRPIARTAPDAPASGSKLPLAWKAGDALVLFEPRAYDQATLAPALARMIEAAGLKGVEGEVVRCSAERFCKVVLRERDRVLDAARTTSVVAALDAKEARATAPGVKVVARNLKRTGFRTPNDELFGYQWDFDFIHMNAAWDISVGDPNLVVAIVDSGLVQAHPDINARIARDPINNTLVGADLISDADLDVDDIPRHQPRGSGRSPVRRAVELPRHAHRRHHRRRDRQRRRGHRRHHLGRSAGAGARAR